MIAGPTVAFADAPGPGPEVEQVVLPQTWSKFVGYAVAEDGSALVYATQEFPGQDLVIRRDLATGTETTIASEGAEGENVPWDLATRDGRWVAYIDGSSGVPTRIQR